MALLHMVAGLSRRQLALALPLGLYLTLVIVYLLFIPTGESPDEPGHLQCIEQVSRFNRLPIVDPAPQGEWGTRENIISGYSCYHMPLYYVLGGYLQRAIQLVAGGSLHYEFPPNNPQWGQSPAMFDHDLSRAQDSGRESAGIVSVRVMSIALGLVILWATYRVATLIFPESTSIPIAATTIVAGWPQFVFMSRAINNDALATGLATVTLVLLLDVGKPRRLPWAALFAALAILSKLSTMLVVAAVVVVYVLEYLLFPSRRSEYLVPGIVGGLVLLALIMLIGVQPTLRSNATLTWNLFNGVAPAAKRVVYWLDVTKLTLSSGFARFGWMSLPAPQWLAYAWWAIIVITGAIGTVLAWTATNLRMRRLMLVIMAIWVTITLASYLRINLNRFQPQFRFIFYSLPLISTLSAAGLLAVADRNGRRQWTTVALLALALLAVNLWLILAIVKPAYVTLTG